MNRGKTIVKNTMYMYIRMAVLMLVSLYTLKVVYNVLGDEDYGVYNLVGGFLVFFGFLNNGLATAVKRYVTTEIATSDDERGRHVFGVCVEAHVMVAIVILLLAETIGLWVVNGLLDIPEGRETAANVVFQMSVIATVVGVLQSPYNTAILAYERMNIYAYMSIVEAVLKLGVALAIKYIDGDKLIIYAILVYAVSLINMAMYRIYAVRNFEICKWTWPEDRGLLREIFGYMGWSVMGQAAVVSSNQGANILVNKYHSVIGNAAMGVSNMVTNTVYAFVSNFQSAFNPQIIKSYATQEYGYLKQLIIGASKLSSYLVMIFLIPIIFEIDKVMEMFLGHYPTYAPEFCIWTLVGQYIDGMASPFWMVTSAQKDIKKYQICISAVYSMNVVVGWIAFAMGSVAYSIMIVRCIVSLGLLATRIAFAKRYFEELDIIEWINKVMVRSLIVISATSVATYCASTMISGDGLGHVVMVSGISVAVSLGMIWKVGLSGEERKMITNMARK